MSERPEWFAPKRYGYGAGLPIAWQGWLVTAVFIAAVLLTAYIFEDQPFIVFAIVAPLVSVMLIITSRTTRGGWRWRRGKRN